MVAGTRDAEDVDGEPDALHPAEECHVGRGDARLGSDACLIARSPVGPPWRRPERLTPQEDSDAARRGPLARGAPVRATTGSGLRDIRVPPGLELLLGVSAKARVCRRLDGRAGERRVSEA